MGRNDTPVPEPTTWAMMLLGFAGLGLAGYRHAKAGGASTRASHKLTLIRKPDRRLAPAS